MLGIGSLFSGIGGLDLGLERAGLGEVRWQVETDEFCRAVLARHWPGAKRDVTDVRKAGRENLEPIDLICGGFPCQPASVAGKRKAQLDERWLWPEYARIVHELRPAIVVIENVLGLRTAGMRDVLSDLAALGFAAEWTCASASEVGSNHLRRRIFIVASDPQRVVVRDEPGWLGRAFESERAPVPRDALEASFAPDADPVRRLESSWRFAEQRGWSQHCGWSFGETPRVDDGLSGELERRRKALGNAVVVRCAHVVGTAIRGAFDLERLQGAS